MHEPPTAAAAEAKAERAARQYDDYSFDSGDEHDGGAVDGARSGGNKRKRGVAPKFAIRNEALDANKRDSVLGNEEKKLFFFLK